MRNYYDILGVDKNADSDEIKAAYRKLAKKYHPDSASETPENKQRFQEIQEAYSVLSDPDKRRTYDYYGHSAYKNSYYAQHHNDAPGDAHSHSHDGACEGHCGACDDHCGACEEGQEKKKDPTWYMHEVRVMVTIPMEDVFQENIVEAVFTEHAGGFSSGGRSGCAEKEWKFHAKIPAGVYHQQLIPFSEAVMDCDEMLEHLAETYPRNYYNIIVIVQTPSRYRQEGWHLCTSCEVDYWTLVLGGEITVQGPDGPCQAYVNPGTLPEARVCVKGKGLNYPPYIGGRSHLYVDLKLRIPKEVNALQREALRHLQNVFTMDQAIPESDADPGTPALRL